MNLLEWANQAKVGDRCSVDGTEVECCPYPKNPGDSYLCDDCVFECSLCSLVNCETGTRDDHTDVRFACVNGKEGPINMYAQVEEKTDQGVNHALCAEYLAFVFAIKHTTELLQDGTLCQAGMSQEERKKAEALVKAIRERLEELQTMVMEFDLKED